MKKIYLLQLLIVLFISVGCTDNQIDEIEEDVNSISTSVEPCFSTTLVAGQNYDAGIVTADIDGDNLIITFSSNGDWVIGTTHLSVGNCDEDWVPLTGSGNPQIGQFEYTEPFSIAPYEVVYVIPLEDLNDNYCFAAHAEVVGPDGNGETAWAEGPEFDGRSWAMYVEATLSDCEEDDDDGNNSF
jgi:hypothetical protein